MMQTLWKTIWRLFKKLGINLSYAIPLPGIYPKKTTTLKDACTPIPIAALFTIARTWKPPRCPSTDKWIKTMWYIDTMEYYSAIEGNEIGSFGEMRLEPEPIVQTEDKSERKRQISYINPYMWDLERWCR